MAIIYCDAAGSNTSPYDTWAKAATTWDTATAAWSTGDVILVKSTSDVSGTSGAALVTTSVGTMATKIPIYTANASDVYTKSTIGSPTFGITAANADLTLQGSLFTNGLAMTIPDRLIMNDAGESAEHRDMSVQFTGAACEFYTGASTEDSILVFRDLIITESTSSSLSILNAGLGFQWIGGSCTVNTAVNGLFDMYSGRELNYDIRGVDFSGSTFGGPLVNMSNQSDTACSLIFTNCAFPTGLTIHDSGFANDGQVIEIIGSGYQDIVYNREKYTYRASLTTSTAVYVTAGMTLPDGSAGDKHISHEIIPNSVFTDGARFEGPWLGKVNTTTGSSQTITIYSADDFTTSPNVNQAYIEVAALDTSGKVVETIATSRASDILATTALTTTTGLWTGSPTHQHKMTCSFTAQEEGIVSVRVVLERVDLSGETANSFYYDPEVNIA